MAVTYPLQLPNVIRNGSIITFNSVKISAINNTAVSASPWTYKSYTQIHAGEQWKLQVSLPLLTHAEAGEWIAFLFALKGQKGTFLAGDPASATPRGSGIGTPKVSANTNAGVDSISTSGWGANSTVLKAGDYLQIGYRLYMTLEDVISNGSGTATINIYPIVRETIAANTNIVIKNAQGLFRLTGDSQSYNVDVASHYSISFSALEAI